MDLIDRRKVPICVLNISAPAPVGGGGVCAAVVRALLGRPIVSPDWVWPRGACQRCDTTVSTEITISERFQE